ncbi:GSCOCG00006797001-RA-CDS [Cotesia congregata]|nr:GSCOCG00006797001-RA-CDS [Cotesia congregata]
MGKSKFTTIVTCATSIPIIKTFSKPALNLSNTAIRCSTVKSPDKIATL